MLLDDIKKANVQAMKDKNVDARKIYSVIMNKALLEGIKLRECGGELTDANMVSILQKAMKELEEECVNFEKAGNMERVEGIKKQMDTIKVFIPAMMDESEIRSIIDNLEDRSIPNVMKVFKSQYAGKVDLKEVSKILKSY